MSILNTLEFKIPKEVCDSINRLNAISDEGYVEINEKQSNSPANTNKLLNRIKLLFKY